VRIRRSMYLLPLPRPVCEELSVEAHFTTVKIRKLLASKKFGDLPVPDWYDPKNPDAHLQHPSLLSPIGTPETSIEGRGTPTELSAQEVL
jgi:hypothetical protein